MRATRVIRTHRRAVAMACGGVAIAGAVLCVAKPARADMDFQVSATAGASWIRTLPALKNPSVSTFARDVPEGKVPVGGSVVALGGTFDIALSMDDRWIIPLLGFSAYGAVGSYDNVLTSVDGSIANVRPWSTYEVDVLLPGIGYRMKRRRFMFSAAVRTGYVHLGMNGTIAAGATSTAFAGTANSALVQVELEACRRLDPLTRVCLHVAPRVYDFSFLNGATLGLRVEWGR